MTDQIDKLNINEETCSLFEKALSSLVPHYSEASAERTDSKALGSAGKTIVEYVTPSV